MLSGKYANECPGVYLKHFIYKLCIQNIILILSLLVDVCTHNTKQNLITCVVKYLLLLFMYKLLLDTRYNNITCHPNRPIVVLSHNEIEFQGHVLRDIFWLHLTKNQNYFSSNIIAYRIAN